MLWHQIANCEGQALQAKEAAEMEALIEKAAATPKGTKKPYGSLEDMPKGYQPKFVEAAL